MTLEVVGPLGLYARYLATYCIVDFFSNFLVAHKVQSTSANFSPWKSPQEWAQLLLHPTSYLLDQHPSLALTIGDHLGDNPVFLRLESIDLQQLIRVIPIKTSEEFGRVIEQEHNTPFDLSDNTSPLWRLLISPIEDDNSSFYLSFVFQHSTSDGRSVMAMTEQFFEQLILEPEWTDKTPDLSPCATTKIAITSRKPIPAPIEDRVNCTPSKLKLLRTLAQSLPFVNSVMRVFGTKYWAGDFDCSAGAPFKVELALMQLTEQETSKVIQATKKRSTTVQSALYTAAAFAIESVFMLSSEEGGSAKEAINCATVTCLRDKIPNPISRMDHGNYVFGPRQNGLYIREESSFWEITHDYRMQVFGAVSTPQKVQELLEDLGLLNYLPNKASAWKDAMINRVGQIQHGREVSLMMSNIGVGWKRPVSTFSQLLVKDGIFSSSPIKTYGAFNMSITTVSGVLSVVTAWDKAAFKERARAELFVSEFKRILLEAVEDGRETYLFKDAKRPHDDNTTAIAL